MRTSTHVYYHPMMPSLTMDCHERQPVLVFRSYGNTIYEPISRTRAAILLKWWRAAR